MALISLKEVSFGYGGPLLLDNIDLQIESGQRIGLLGRNGAGKSTLMKMVHGEVEPDAGEVIRQQSLKTALLGQEVPQNIQGSVFEVVAQGLGPAGDTVAAYHRSNPGPAGATSEGPPAQLEEAQEVLAAEGGWELLTQVERVIKLMELEADGEFSVLSAGMKRRVLIARALATGPQILLLDEPTNHLDIDTIRWLEEFLARLDASLVFVTHDRAFLRRLATRIVELERGRLLQWSCDYDTFLKRREALLNDEKRYQALFTRKLAQEEAWIRQGIKARRTRDEGRVRRLVAMREEQQQVRHQVGKVRMRLQDADRSGRLVIRAEGLTFGYDGEPLIRDFSTMVMRGDRIGILGPNGIGKTTLIRLLLGQVEPAAGTLKHGTRLAVTYFDQLREQLDEEKTVKQNLAGDLEQVIQNGRPRHVFGYLSDFLFSPDRSKSKVKFVSGGERNRLLLAKLFLKSSNFLVLDEPTNDLDVETLELLEELLLDFSGTLMLVSHDRAFLNNVVTSVYAFEGEGQVREYTGGYDDWLRHKNAAAAAESEAKGTQQPRPRPQSEKPRKLSYKDQKELEALPLRIETLEADQQELHTAMADPAFYQKPGDGIAAAKTKLDAVEAELAQAYSRWEELEELGE